MMIKNYKDYMKDFQDFCKKQNCCVNCCYSSIDCEANFLYDEIQKDIIEVEDDLK